jgi:hypothetical protein
MQPRYTTVAAGSTLTALGLAVGLALGSGSGKPTLAAVSSPPLEVRTQVIRRTVHVYRHTKPAHAPAGSPPRRPGPGATGAPATRASGGVAQPVPAAVTRSSGSRPAAHGESGGGPHGVRTRTSGAAGGGPGSPRPLATHSSGGGHEDGRGGQDD